MQIKLCGINNIELAKKALDAGADLIGLVLTPTSRRYVSVEIAKKIVKAVQQKNSTPVIVFRHEPFETIMRVVDKLGDCIVQFQATQRNDTQKIIELFNTIVAFSAQEFIHIPIAAILGENRSNPLINIGSCR